MKLTWYGHSCFLLEDEKGVGILTDPCSPDTGYAIQGVKADIVTVSHDHYDHNYVASAVGEPQIISTPGKHQVCGVTITGFSTWHDEVQGEKRGANLLFLMELDGVRVLHLGDLGHELNDETIAAIGTVDVLLCPIGGVFTIDAQQAINLAERIRPSVFIPMHYLTPSLTFNIAGLDPLLQAVKSYNVHRIKESSCSVYADSLGEKRLLILDYQK